MPLLPGDEQSRFVALTSGFRDVASNTECVIRRLDELRASLLADLLSGEHEIPVSYDRFLDRAS